MAQMTKIILTMPNHSELPKLENNIYYQNYSVFDHHPHILVGATYDAENRRQTREELQTFGIPMNKVGMILRMTINVIRMKMIK